MQRFINALEGKTDGRVPVFPLVAGWAAANFSPFPLGEVARDADKLAAAQITARDAAGYDPVYAYVDPLYVPEAFGCRVRFLPTGPLLDPLTLRPESPADLEALPRPDPEHSARMPVMLEAAARLQAYARGRIPVVGLLEGPFTTACRIIEAEHVMRMTYKAPGALDVLLERVTGTLLAMAEALVRHGANTLFLAEPTASSAMIAPKLFEQRVLPHIGRITGRLRAPVILHVCGDTAPLMEYLGRTRARVLSLDQCMDLGWSRAKVPDRVLAGNLDPVHTLLMGTPEQVEAGTWTCLRAAGSERFILMSGCSVPPSAPLENVRRMTMAAEDYAVRGTA